MRAFALASALTAAVTAYQTSSVTSWTDNPTNLGPVIVLTPDSAATASPALVLGLHPCGSTGAEYQSMTTLPDYIDERNFVMLFPTANAAAAGGLNLNCWDASSARSNAHGGGGDSEGLAGLVAWAIGEYGVDAGRSYVVGAGSGAMEANVLAAAYPGLFRAGISYSGAPAGCWRGATSATPFAPDQDCPFGTKASTYTQQDWVDLVSRAHPGYAGPWPAMMVVHGTADPAVAYGNFWAQLDQWSGVHGVAFSRNETDTPTAGWDRVVYGDGTHVVGYSVENGGHIPPFQVEPALEWFDLTTRSVAVAETTTTSVSSPTPRVPHYYHPNKRVPYYPNIRAPYYPNTTTTTTTTTTPASVPPTSSSVVPPTTITDTTTVTDTATYTTTDTVTDTVTATATTTVSVTETATPAPTSGGSCSSLYGQCGGLYWTGPTCCDDSTCQYSNDYYSQCL
ncbi:Alpha/Beta hydrolase protein [Xylariaceae sp. FL0804]|nr:Alpha/Beta hydrolase protein [Xylariaceae sp. FL0804]